MIKAFSATFLGTNNVSGSPLASGTNADGAYPIGGVVLDGTTLYGTTGVGGTSNEGTIFMTFTNGASFSTLKNFDRMIGAQCDSKFVLSGSTLYGTAVDGGTNGGGVIFGLTVLPQILRDGNLGIRTNAFGFDFTGISNQTAVIEVSTQLFQPGWSPLQTNLLIGAPLYFSDTNSRQRPSAFYRIGSP